ncbi:MAG: hypothetical protein V4718_04075 [Pseudomonadota bacterium]
MNHTRTRADEASHRIRRKAGCGAGVGDAAFVSVMGTRIMTVGGTLHRGTQ